MTVPNSPDNGGMGRSIGDAAGRGAVLVGIAVLIGVVLLWAGFDRSSGDASTDDSAGTDTVAADTDSDSGADEGNDSGAQDDGNADSGADSGNDAGTDTDGSADTGADAGVDGPVPSTGPPGTAHPPNEVIVFVGNGTGVGGEAGRVADQLTAANYTAIAGNAASAPVEASAIYYRPEYGPDAKLIADVLQAPASLIQQMPADPGVSPDHQADADSAQVIVIIGTDGLVTG